MGGLRLVTGKGVPGSIRKERSASGTGASLPGLGIRSPCNMSTSVSSRPRRADAERNRSRILAAASELFAQRGLDASMPELAERAGVGVGTVYRAFPDKDHLLGAVMAERFRWLTGEIEAAALADDPWTAFTDIV